jgi:hypothetical protein
MFDEEVLTFGKVVNCSKLAERTRYQLTRRRFGSPSSMWGDVGERIETQKARVWREGERQ